MSGAKGLFCFLGLKQSKIYAGESFKGYLILLIDDDNQLAVQNVSIEINGFEETIWFDGVKQDQRHGTKRSLGSQQTLLWSSNEEEAAAADDTSSLTVGTHTFPFELSTNATLPSSYEDSGANVSLFNGHDFMPKSFHADQRPSIRFKVDALVNGVVIASQPIQIWQRVVLPPPEPPLVASQAKTFLLGKHPVEVTASVAHNGNCFIGDGVAIRLTVAQQWRAQGRRRAFDARQRGAAQRQHRQGDNVASRRNRHSHIAVELGRARSNVDA
jgi:hypothetical protein